MSPSNTAPAASKALVAAAIDSLSNEAMIDSVLLIQVQHREKSLPQSKRNREADDLLVSTEELLLWYSTFTGNTEIVPLPP